MTRPWCRSCSVWTRWSPSRLCLSCFLRRRWLRQSSPTVAMRPPPSQFFDKVVDMPVVAPLQYVDKLVISLLCRSRSFQGARLEKTVLSHSCRALRKSLRSQRCSTRTVVDVPVMQVVRVSPVQVVVETVVSDSCVAEKLVEIPENEYICKVFTRRQAVAAWRRVKGPSTTKSSSSWRARGWCSFQLYKLRLFRRLGLTLSHGLVVPYAKIRKERERERERS